MTARNEDIFFQFAKHKLIFRSRPEAKSSFEVRNTPLADSSKTLRAKAIFAICSLGASVFIGAATAAPTVVYVDDQATDFHIKIDQSFPGLDTGDEVIWSGADGTSVGGLVFGTDAFLSVQSAVDAVEAGGTIYIAEGYFDDGRQIAIETSVNIQGAGAESTILSGGGSHGVIFIFQAPEPVEVTLLDLTISDGNYGQGGGIRVGGYQSHFPPTSLNVVRCVIRDNVAGGGGGIALEPATNGNNIPTSALIVDSSLVNNESRFDFGGGILALGIPGNPGSRVQIVNTTISGNIAKSGGGIAITSAGAQTGGPSLESVNCTIVRNHATDHSTGGVWVSADLTGLDAAYIANTIIAGNTSSVASSGTDVSGSFASNEYNFVGDPSGSTGFENDLSLASTGTNLEDVLDPILSYNGGSTPTHALIAGGAATDTGNDSDAVDIIGDPLQFDQRGSDRVFGPHVDIGSFELAITDIDGDGVPDEEDPFPNSDVDHYVDIEGCATDVANRFISSGTTLADLVNAIIEDCKEETKPRWLAPGHVVRRIVVLKRSGVVTRDEFRSLVQCIAKIRQLSKSNQNRGPSNGRSLGKRR